MKLAPKVAVAGLMAIALVLSAAGPVSALQASFGNWVVNYANADTAAPHYDAAYVNGFYKTKMVEWLYKTKFLEVGERKVVAGNPTYAIEWTRFDFALNAVMDQRVGQTTFRYVASGGVYGCYDVIEAKYEGTYTQQDGAVKAIQFTQLFKYIRDTCDGWSDASYFYDATASGPAGVSYFWRVVTVQNPDLGNINCITTSYNGYNGAAANTMVDINDNSVGPTPPSQPAVDAWAYTTVGGVLRVLKYDMPDRLVGGASFENDLIGTFNINLDTKWYFDRGVGELLHDASASENGGTIGDTSCVNLVVMFEYQSEVFFNAPAVSQRDLTRHWTQGF